MTRREGLLDPGCGICNIEDGEPDRPARITAMDGVQPASIRRPAIISSGAFRTSSGITPDAVALAAAAALGGLRVRVERNDAPTTEH